MGVKHTVLPDGQPATVAFTVLAQLCGPVRLMKWRSVPPYSPKMVREGTLTLTPLSTAGKRDGLNNLIRLINCLESQSKQRMKDLVNRFNDAFEFGQLDFQTLNRTKDHDMGCVWKLRRREIFYLLLIPATLI